LRTSRTRIRKTAPTRRENKHRRSAGAGAEGGADKKRWRSRERRSAPDSITARLDAAACSPVATARWWRPVEGRIRYGGGPAAESRRQGKADDCRHESRGDRDVPWSLKHAPSVVTVRQLRARRPCGFKSGVACPGLLTPPSIPERSGAHWGGGDRSKDGKRRLLWPFLRGARPRRPSTSGMTAFSGCLYVLV